jgi:rare lipoprotein A (peptidoglycan hydrolase)
VLPPRDTKPRHSIHIGTMLAVSQQSSTAAEAPLSITGEASWYGLTGNPTSNGEEYDPRAMTAAMHPNVVGPHGRIPFGTMVTVTYTRPGARVPTSIHVRVNDHGPWLRHRPHPTRVIDLTPAAYEALTGIKPGSEGDPGVVGPVTVTLPR